MVDSNWHARIVAARFEEAARVAHRLPPARVQGYFNAWPAIRRMPWENLGVEPAVCFIPPSPELVERMLEATRWVLWLDEEQRHLVWMRAQRYPWRDICRRLGCDRSTAWRRWQLALTRVADALNAGEVEGSCR
jgi:predicted DNA-binding protein (UPF0251 family)